MNLLRIRTRRASIRRAQIRKAERDRRAAEVAALRAQVFGTGRHF